jgi:hypothetical protein
MSGAGGVSSPGAAAVGSSVSVGAGVEVGTVVGVEDGTAVTVACGIGAAQDAKRIVTRNRNVDLLRMSFSVYSDCTRLAEYPKESCKNNFRFFAGRAGLKPPAQRMEALRAGRHARVGFIRLSCTEAGL